MRLIKITKKQLFCTQYIKKQDDPVARKPSALSALLHIYHHMVTWSMKKICVCTSMKIYDNSLFFSCWFFVREMLLYCKNNSQKVFI